jgi:hypothetical protein
MTRTATKQNLESNLGFDEYTDAYTTPILKSSNNGCGSYIYIYALKTSHHLHAILNMADINGLGKICPAANRVSPLGSS